MYNRKGLSLGPQTIQHIGILLGLMVRQLLRLDMAIEERDIRLHDMSSAAFTPSRQVLAESHLDHLLILPLVIN